MKRETIRGRTRVLLSEAREAARLLFHPRAYVGHAFSGNALEDIDSRVSPSVASGRPAELQLLIVRAAEACVRRTKPSREMQNSTVAAGREGAGGGNRNAAALHAISGAGIVAAPKLRYVRVAI